MTEVVLISTIILLTLIMGAVGVWYMQTHKKTPLDYFGWTLAIIIYNIFILILGIATIVCYLK